MTPRARRQEPGPVDSEERVKKSDLERLVDPYLVRGAGRGLFARYPAAQAREDPDKFKTFCEALRTLHTAKHKGEPLLRQESSDRSMFEFFR